MATIAAKQLITIGCALQGLYVALFATDLLKTHVPGRVIAAMSVSLGLVMLFSALAVCAVQVKFDVFRTFELFRFGCSPSDENLMGAISEWCVRVERAVMHKRSLLITAKIFLASNFGASFYALWLMWTASLK